MQVALDLSAVVLTLADDVPRVLVVERDGLPALPTGDFDADHDRSLDRGVRRWVAGETGLELGFVEQLYTFGDLGRVPGDPARRVSIAYLAFVRTTGAVQGWRDLYEFFPWEDRREGEPLLELIAPALERWADGVPARRERVDTTFGLGGSPWDPVRSLERYELLYEAGLVAEAHRVGRRGGVSFGAEAVLDHRRILASALGRVRGKLTYRPVVFELLPETFTLLQLQRVVEALAGVRLHKGNFRRLVESGRLVEGTGEMATGTRGRPAELFRFRREVLRERPAPGVGIRRTRR